MNNKVVFVVGAAGGTGTEVTRILVDRGYGVVGTVLNTAEGNRLRSEVPDILDIAEIDLSDGDAVGPKLQPLLDKYSAEFVGVIVAAAQSSYGPLEIMPLALGRQIMEVNMFSNLAVYQTCMPYLRHGKGRMLFISSFGGRVALPFIGQYVASKFALEGLCDVMRREAKHFDVPIIVVEPGGIRTPMVSNQLVSIDEDIAALSPEHAELYLDRYGEWRKIAHQSYGSTSPPEFVAKIVVDAFEDPDPQARYVAGEDAQELIALAMRSSDTELDLFFRAMYSGSGGIAEAGKQAAAL